MLAVPQAELPAVETYTCWKGSLYTSPSRTVRAKASLELNFSWSWPFRLST